MSSLGGALLVWVKLPDEVSLVDLPHLVPRDLLHQQQLRGHCVRGQDASAETRGLSAGDAAGGRGGVGTFLQWEVTGEEWLAPHTPLGVLTMHAHRPALPLPHQSRCLQNGRGPIGRGVLLWTGPWWPSPRQHVEAAGTGGYPEQSSLQHGRTRPLYKRPAEAQVLPGAEGQQRQDAQPEPQPIVTKMEEKLQAWRGAV